MKPCAGADSARDPCWPSSAEKDDPLLEMHGAQDPKLQQLKFLWMFHRKGNSSYLLVFLSTMVQRTLGNKGDCVYCLRSQLKYIGRKVTTTTSSGEQRELKGSVPERKCIKTGQHIYSLYQYPTAKQ